MAPVQGTRASQGRHSLRGSLTTKAPSSVAPESFLGNWPVGASRPALAWSPRTRDALPAFHVASVWWKLPFHLRLKPSLVSELREISGSRVSSEKPAWCHPLNLTRVPQMPLITQRTQLRTPQASWRDVDTSVQKWVSGPQGHLPWRPKARACLAASPS